MINEFSGQFRFLSNFHPVFVNLDNDPLPYPSVEHAYQAAKSLFPAERERIRYCVTAGAAKRAGRKVKLRGDWEDIKIEVMLDLLRQKFSFPVLRERLLATGEQELIEGNYWGDTYWGVCPPVGGVGQNMLGTLLMRVRAEIVASAKETV